MTLPTAASTTAYGFPVTFYSLELGVCGNHLDPFDSLVAALIAALLWLVPRAVKMLRRLRLSSFVELQLALLVQRCSQPTRRRFGQPASLLSPLEAWFEELRDVRKEQEQRHGDEIDTMLHHPTSVVRLAALECLSRRNAAAYTDTLLGLLKDDSQCVRGEALKALVKIMQFSLLARRHATEALRLEDW